MFEIHPTGTGGGGRAIRSILRDQKNAKLDNGWVRCYQCGFPNKLDRIASGDAYDRQASLMVTTAVTLTAGGTLNVRQINDSVEGGCRFCHSLNVLGRKKLTLASKKAPRPYVGG